LNPRTPKGTGPEPVAFFWPAPFSVLKERAVFFLRACFFFFQKKKRAWRPGFATPAVENVLVAQGKKALCLGLQKGF